MSSPRQITSESSDTQVRFYVPVTLREVEAHDVPLDSAFGMDADEHEELLDAPDILRAVFSVEVNDQWEDVADAVGYSIDLECYDARFGEGAAWRSCLALSPRGGPAPNATNKLNGLLGHVAPEWYSMLDAAAIPFREWAEQVERDYGETDGGDGF